MRLMNVADSSLRKTLSTNVLTDRQRYVLEAAQRDYRKSIRRHLKKELTIAFGNSALRFWTLTLTCLRDRRRSLLP